MGMFSDQLNQVLRRLSRAPLFTAITLITLAVGVGANTVIFSVVEGVLLKPLPYPHPEQLIGVWHTAPGIGMKELNMCAVHLLHRSRAKHHPPGHRRLRRRFAERDRRGRAGARDGARRHRRHIADPGRGACAGTLVYPQRRLARCAGDGAAVLWILAAEVRRRILRHRARHHSGRKAAGRSSACCPEDFIFSISRIPRWSCRSNGTAARQSSATSARAPLPGLSPE